nr:arsenate reductase (glutaredoxin) [Sphingobium sp. 15-1]
MAGRVAGEGRSPVKAIIWHNPRCSKSRQALAILEATPGVEVEVVEYLKTPPSRTEIEAVLAKAGVRSSEAVRKGEAVVKEIGLDLTDNKAVLDAMAQHPILIERAIVITDKGAVIARPPERVSEVL